MLVLSREKEQVIYIKHGDVTTEIKVLEIRGQRVKLGFTAPKDVIIHRAEIKENKNE